MYIIEIVFFMVFRDNENKLILCEVDKIELA